MTGALRFACHSLYTKVLYVVPEEGGGYMAEGNVIPIGAKADSEPSAIDRLNALIDAEDD